ncbi:hypothetical protein LLE98_01545 [Holdemanella porci]|uniref:hypothetical protein n=1 Tax=Holdemanella porci TaxID=2652276 RepID=UPI001D154BD9|nr:hypothetical protein [Holdemanella porci]MCC3360032.1 hypothetical protein [Holdemanella porci]
MKTLKMILLTAVIVVPLYIAIADPFFGMFQPVNKVAQEDNYDDKDYDYDPDDVIEDQEVHIDGFPVIYIEGNNEISREHWEGFLADLQNECNIPWLTKNVSSIHFCSDEVYSDIHSDNPENAGFISTKDNSIYIHENGSAGYESTILHEFGHAYDNTYGITSGNYDISVLTSNQNKTCKHANKMGDSYYEYCSSTIQETFADAIQFYITSRNAGLVPEEVFNWIDTLPR